MAKCNFSSYCFVAFLKLSVGKGYPTNKSQVYVSNWFTVAFPDYRFLRFSIFALSSHTPKKKRSYYTVLPSKVQCSMEIVFHLITIMVMLSCHVMSCWCYVTLPTLFSPYLLSRLVLGVALVSILMGSGSFFHCFLWCLFQVLRASHSFIAAY